MAKGDEKRRKTSHSSKHSFCNIGASAERQEARRTLATLTARAAIGAESGEEARAKMSKNKEVAREFKRVFESFLNSQ